MIAVRWRIELVDERRSLHQHCDLPQTRDWSAPFDRSRTAVLTWRRSIAWEGHTLAEMKRLTRALLARGQRTFVLSLHSPSVVPGHTPYVRTDADLVALLQRLREYLRFFRDELRGRFVTPACAQG